MKQFRSTKTYSHDVGLSCAFRQWRASQSHCQFLHGYAIAVHLEFSAATLDHRNWVLDFGGFKELKQWLQEMFDHTTLVAEDDPMLDEFKEAYRRKMLDLRIVPAVGCEKFAEMIFDRAQQMFEGDRVKLEMVEVREHGGNSAKVVAK